MALEALSRQPRLRRQFRTVRSIQRLPSLPARNCRWIAMEYMRWLPGAFIRLIDVRVDEGSGRIEFRIRGLPWSLLVLKLVPEPAEGGEFGGDRMKFHIVGGVLTRTTDTGWLEFRQVEKRRYTLASIHEFVPRLPWFIYLLTQAPLHAWTMRRFGDHLNATR
jgi:hypothetical protein